MAEAAPGPRPRPISPNIQLNGGVWRWHLTMAASIFHRVSGVGLYIGALALMVWAMSLASGADAYGRFEALAGSIFGKAGFLILSLCAFYHAANGLRHLFWDAGYGFKPETATRTAWLVIAFAFVATAFFWVMLALAGAV
jgi:succinate dehydrogenase / fumarate reductase cytochrome b subunit